MANMLDFFLKLKTINKWGTGLNPSKMRDSLLSEHRGPEMHAKLNQVHRSKRKRGNLL